MQNLLHVVKKYKDIKDDVEQCSHSYIFFDTTIVVIW